MKSALDVRRARSLWVLASTVLGLLLALAVVSLEVKAQGGQPPGANPNVRPPANAVISGAPGGVERPGNYDIEIWKKVRQGVQGRVSIPDTKAGQLVQSDGEAWRNFRNGPLPTYGLWALSGVVAVLALFYLLRGRIRIEHGWAGRTLTRFTELERFGHWLLAVSFIILALTGLNLLYGRHYLLPLMGPEAFSFISMWGKLLHNYIAFAFMVGLALTFLVWIRHNLPTWRDVVWLAKGGGLLVRGSHVAAWKFNAGQKIVFWAVMLGGLSLVLSGLDLLFPFQVAMFSKTFAALNSISGSISGFCNKIGLSGDWALHLPTNLTAVQEMQYATTWHSIVALLLTVVIIGHIYIGTLGMQGAFSAMGTGQVDVNWAKEHHILWAEQELVRMEQAAAVETGGVPPAMAPAE